LNTWLLNRRTVFLSYTFKKFIARRTAAMGQGASTSSPEIPAVRETVMHSAVTRLAALLCIDGIPILMTDFISFGLFSLLQDKPKKKLGIKTGKPICCCCPDTKKARDECVVFKGEEDPDCKKLIEAHKMCLRDEGFDVK
jgi:cytochrome c oxidase assembly protein subunit 17